VLLPDFWITFYYYYPCTMAVQFDALVRQRCAVCRSHTPVPIVDLNRDSCKRRPRRRRVGGTSWREGLLCPCSCIRVRECTVLGPSRRIWRDNPGKSRHMVCAIYIGAYDIYHWHVENMRWTRGRGEDRASELREQNKDFDE